MDFLFHRVSEKEKEGIKKDSGRIMDDFSEKLSKVSMDMKEPLIHREEWERKEGNKKCSDIDREIMFGNALYKEGDFLIAERKKW